MTPGLADGLRDLSFVLRIRLPRCHVCGLLLNPTCPDSSGIHALGRRRRPSGRLERRAPVVADARPPVAGNLSGPVGCVGLRKPVAGLGGRMVRLRLYEDMTRMGICEAWVAVYGLRNVGLRTLRFFVNLWKAAGVWWGSIKIRRLSSETRLKSDAEMTDHRGRHHRIELMRIPPISAGAGRCGNKILQA